jgi:O-antigen ligase
VVTSLVVIVALILGGSSKHGLWSNGLVELSSLLLFALFALRWQWPSLPPAAIFVVAALFVIPLLQLIPLPPSIWTLLPGRQEFAATYEQLGLALPYLPVSLDPQSTWRSLLSLLPGVAVFLATLDLDARARRSISVIFIAFGVIGVLLGFAQLAQGPDSALRIFYPQTNIYDTVGFFANRNHHAALLYGLIPLTAAWTTGFLFDRRPERFFGLGVCVLVYIAFILGLGVSRSRAGLVLGVMAAVASLLLAANNESRLAKRSLAIMIAATVLAAILIVQFALFSLIGRLNEGVIGDLRIPIAQNTMAAIKVFQPIGSGIGTFVDVYKMFEMPESLRPEFVNHAHNDWLELWLEGGWLALIALVVFVVWFGWSAYRTWRLKLREGRVLDRALSQGAVITMLLLMAHSLVDYPLRTVTLMTLFGYCAALVLRPPRMAEAGEDRDGRDDTERYPRERYREPRQVRRSGAASGGSSGPPRRRPMPD